MADIFLSYSRKDSAFMQRLRDSMRKAGFDVWTDETGLQPGTPAWKDEIEKQIEAAGCMVVVLSPDAKTSKWVDREISYAEIYNKTIFPVLARGDERQSVPIDLINHQRVDARQDEAAAAARLCGAIGSCLGRGGGAQPARAPTPSRPAAPASGSWTPGKAHSSAPHVVAGDTPNNWKPAPGYTWVSDAKNDMRVVWKPGQVHSGHPHVIAADKEGNWKPAPGYKWVSESASDMRVLWEAGKVHTDHPHVKAAAEEGNWKPAPGYKWVSEAVGDLRVVWAPGKVHTEHPNVLAADAVGEWKPAAGYTWVTQEAGDFRVKKKA